MARTGARHPRLPPALTLLSEPSLQIQFSPASRCFGCGPANEHGLGIESHEPDEAGEPGELVADWQPLPHHAAFEGVLNGGIIGTLLDCHSNWAATWHLMQKTSASVPPCTVTASYAITLKRPTPSDGPVHLEARIVESTDDRAIVEATLTARGKVCAICRGTFVAVKPDHPAYHRW